MLIVIIPVILYTITNYYNAHTHTHTHTAVNRANAYLDARVPAVHMTTHTDVEIERERERRRAEERDYDLILSPSHTHAHPRTHTQTFSKSQRFHTHTTQQQDTTTHTLELEPHNKHTKKRVRGVVGFGVSYQLDKQREADRYARAHTHALLLSPKHISAISGTKGGVAFARAMDRERDTSAASDAVDITDTRTLVLEPKHEYVRKRTRGFKFGDGRDASLSVNDGIGVLLLFILLVINCYNNCY